MWYIGAVLFFEEHSTVLWFSNLQKKKNHLVLKGASMDYKKKPGHFFKEKKSSECFWFWSS